MFVLFPSPASHRTLLAAQRNCSHLTCHSVCVSSRHNRELWRGESVATIHIKPTGRPDKGSSVCCVYSQPLWGENKGGSSNHWWNYVNVAFIDSAVQQWELSTFTILGITSQWPLIDIQRNLIYCWSEGQRGLAEHWPHLAGFGSLRWKNNLRLV